jgi:phosphoribosylanthranilate isomerase
MLLQVSGGQPRAGAPCTAAPSLLGSRSMRSKVLLPMETARKRSVQNSRRMVSCLQIEASEEDVRLVELGTPPLVKMCGITSPEDAAMAAKAGANYAGMIVWPKSKRSVCLSLAREIAAAAREGGAEPVGVFVDENAAEIEDMCIAAGLGIAQLHGDGARSAWMQGLPETLKLIYVVHANKNGVIQTPLPEDKSNHHQRIVDWLLVDSMQGGSGEKFEWSNFHAPAKCSKEGWLLAGGLTPQNVGVAVSLVRPSAVDVSSGIAGADGIRKDPALIQAFMDAVHNSSLTNLPHQQIVH